MKQPRRRLLYLALLLAWTSSPTDAAEKGDAAEVENPAYSTVEALNAGLPRIADPPDLETPQAALENFVFSCDRGDYARAARSLNLNAIAPRRQAMDGPNLARQLKAVMDRHVWFRWGDIPDRADGQVDDPTLRAQTEEPKGPRSSIKIDSLTLGDLDLEVRLQRVKPADGRPVWVVSRQTVKHIPLLFDAYGPSRLELSLPEFLKSTRFLKVALWQWIGFAVILLAGWLLGLLVQKGLDAILRWRESVTTRTLADAIRGPGALAIGLGVFHHLAMTYLGLAGPILSLLEPVFISVFVLTLVWFLRRLIGVIADLVCRRYETYNSDEANVLLTRITVARHSLTFLVLIVGALYVLTRFEWFRQVGVTLLASAGIAGLILGVAAQRVLGNLFAGLVLAITQPVKSGDAVLFEGEFGWIEEIAITYLVIRLWDLRRIIVPITYFLDHPVQNWSRRSQHLIMPVFLRADYRIDVEAVRAEFKKVLESAPEWDKTVPAILQVTDLKDDLIELRALCSAGDPTSNWNLRCRVREHLLGFIRDLEGGRYLPRRRLAMVDEGPPARPSRAEERREVAPHADGSEENREVPEFGGPPCVESGACDAAESGVRAS